MSKMGISVISSYRGGYNFEAVGLSRSLVAEFFPGMPSRISGIGLRGIQEKIAEQHARAFDEDVDRAADRRLLQVAPRRRDATPSRRELIHMLQDAVTTDSPTRPIKQVHARRCASLPPIHLRDLLDFKPDREPVAARRGRDRSPRSASAS